MGGPSSPITTMENILPLLVIVFLPNLMSAASELEQSSFRKGKHRVLADEEDIVARVIKALTPDVEKAVDLILSGVGLSLSTGPEIKSSIDGQRVYETVPSSPSQPGSIKLTNNHVASALADEEEDVTDKPVYNFEYRVAAEKEKTFLSQSEERDGDNLKGVYSYVNPKGSLITVNYQAGPMGFSQTLDQKNGFLDFPSSAVISAKAQPAESDGTFDKIEGANKDRTMISVTKNDEFEIERIGGNPMLKTGTSERALVNQIVAALQPDITAAVKSVLKQKDILKMESNNSSSVEKEKSALPRLRLNGRKSGDTENQSRSSGGVFNEEAGKVHSEDTVAREGSFDDANILNTFGNGLYVKINTPNSDIFY